MKRKLVASALAAAIAVGAYPTAARALNLPQVPNLPIPPILIPDICLAFTGCPVQFTDYTLLVKLQEYRALVQNFANIKNIAGLQGAIQQTVAIYTASKAAPPMQQAVVAGKTTIDTEPDTETRIAAIDAQAQAADGVQQQGQVMNSYLSSVAGGVDKTNALHSTKLGQDNARDIDSVATIANETGNATWADGATL
jgi:hypothetical protein